MYSWLHFRISTFSHFQVIVMIFVSDKAKEKVSKLMEDASIANKPDYFLRVSVVGGGCSGLSYKLDFDN